jgi:hypothetical protein
MSKEGFDLEAVYDAEIAPLMTQIIEICHKHKLPMFATFLCMNDPDESGDDLVCTTSLLFKERPIPDKLMSLPGVLLAKRSPLRMRVTKGDGSIEETIVL